MLAGVPGERLLYASRMDSPLRIGLLGAARIAPFALLSPARQVPQVQVAAIAARDSERAGAFAKKHGVPRVLGSYAALIDDPAIDAIYNPLPNALHAEWTLRALAASPAQPFFLWYHYKFVHLPYWPHERYRRLFGPVMEFGCEFDGIVCKSSDLDTPIASSDPVMAAYARRQLEHSVGLDPKSIDKEVRQLVLILLPTGRCSVENVARHLGVDRRTVHRHLEREGLTFSALVNQARLDLSERYLAHPTRTMAEIADLLGFLGPSALARWHQAQFGVPATARRKTLLAQASPRAPRAGTDAS